MSIREIRNLCSAHIESIFSDLVDKGLANLKDKFFLDSKRRILYTSFRNLYPLMEFSTFLPESYFYYNSHLFAYAFFLDQSLDELRNYPSHQVKSFQISSYLLIRYFEWIKRKYRKEFISLFYKYYKEQSDYLIDEKKWEQPNNYFSLYGDAKKIYIKEILLFFPLELYKSMTTSSSYLLLKKLFTNYYSFILLFDDLIDWDDDIHNRRLSYPIIMYFKLNKKLPQTQEELKFILSHLIENLKEFYTNIRKIEKQIGRKSLIIQDTLYHMRKELSNRGIEL